MDKEDKNCTWYSAEYNPATDLAVRFDILRDKVERVKFILDEKFDDNPPYTGRRFLDRVKSTVEIYARLLYDGEVPFDYAAPQFIQPYIEKAQKLVAADPFRLTIKAILNEPD